MFRQIRKHAATTSSVGHRGGAPTPTHSRYTIHSDCVFESDFGFLTSANGLAVATPASVYMKTEPTQESVIKIKIGEQESVAEEWLPAPCEDFIEFLEEEEDPCLKEIYSGFLSELKTHSGEFLVMFDETSFEQNISHDSACEIFVDGVLADTQNLKYFSSIDDAEAYIEEHAECCEPVPDADYFRVTNESEDKKIVVYHIEVNGGDHNVEYSSDARNWFELPSSAGRAINPSETIYFRGDNPNGLSDIQNGAYMRLYITEDPENPGAYATIDGDIRTLTDLNNPEGNVKEMAGLFEESGALRSCVSRTSYQLSDYCFKNLFKNCESLSTVFCLTADITYTGCLEDWMVGVSDSGRFVYSCGVEWPSGTSGIPTGWSSECE